MLIHGHGHLPIQSPEMELVSIPVELGLLFTELSISLASGVQGLCGPVKVGVTSGTWPDDWDRASRVQGLGYMFVLADDTRTTTKAAGNAFLSVSPDPHGALGDKKVSLEHRYTGYFGKPGPM